MRKPLADRVPFAKIAAILGVAILIGLGLCGIDATMTHLRDPGEEFGPNTVVGIIGAIAFLLSVAGLVLTGVLWVVAELVRSFSREDSEPPHIIDRDDDGDETK
jgi:quinol-cytochrome oxidoreductase complex cytochrome b subunit